VSVTPYEIVPQFALARDGRLIAFVRDATEADVWVMTTPK
jgi:hypothetical protein